MATQIVEASVILKPSFRMLETGVQTQTIDSFLEEKYPGWKTEFLSFFGQQLGVEEMLSLPPVGIAALGICFCLMKERKL